MRRVFGPRTVFEAAFLIAVPVVAAAIGSGMWAIIGASAVAYLLIVVLEATAFRERSPESGPSRLRRPARTVRAEPAALPGEPPAPPSSTAPPSEIAPVAVEQAAAAEPMPPAPAPPVAVAPEPAAHPGHVRVLPVTPEPEPEPEPTPEPEPAPAPEPEPERPPLAAVPEPPPPAPLVAVPELPPVPPAEAVPDAEPEPLPQTVVPIGVSAVPRQWNLWDLERLTRESSGDDAAQDEERQFLLMYLREFADADGLLPIDFDGLVRDSFGELVGAR